MNGNLADYVIQSLMQQQGLGLPQNVPQRPMMPDLQLLQQIDSQEPAMAQSFTPPMQMNEGNAFLPNTPQAGQGGPVPTGDIANKIQEWLGAKQPDEGNFPQQALSKRFEQQSQGGPSFSDYSRAIQASAYGKPTSAQDYADAGLKQQLDLLGSLSKLKSSGGATGELVDRLMKENPKLTFDQALFRVQTGYRRDMEIDPTTGERILAPGAVGAVSQYEQAKKYGNVKGSNLAENQQKLPAAMQSANLALDTIDKALNHPGFDSNFGEMSYIPNRRGGEAADARSYIDQIGGQNFLQAYNTLKGGGQITEVEGVKAEAAMARLAAAQSAESARAALNDLKAVIRTGLENTVKQASGEWTPETNVLPNQPDLKDPGFQEFLRQKGLVP